MCRDGEQGAGGSAEAAAETVVVALLDIGPRDRPFTENGNVWLVWVRIWRLSICGGSLIPVEFLTTTISKIILLFCQICEAENKYENAPHATTLAEFRRGILYLPTA